LYALLRINYENLLLFMQLHRKERQIYLVRIELYGLIKIPIIDTKNYSSILFEDEELEDVLF
jgi:hypothetical protein